MHVCRESYATHAILEALPACWQGLDLRSASGKMLKVWGMREVVYNAMDLYGKVFTVRIPFVVCEVRRPLLSLAMLEDKGFPFDSERWLPGTWTPWWRGQSAKTGKLLSC